MANNKEIGSRITFARERAKMTKKELADIVQLHPSTIGHYEDGSIVRIKIPVIKAIANALHVNPLWITGRSEFIETEKMLADHNNLKPDEDDLLFIYRALDVPRKKVLKATATALLQSQKENG